MIRAETSTPRVRLLDGSEYSWPAGLRPPARPWTPRIVEGALSIPLEEIATVEGLNSRRRLASVSSDVAGVPHGLGELLRSIHTGGQIDTPLGLMRIELLPSSARVRLVSATEACPAAKAPASVRWALVSGHRRQACASLLRHTHVPAVVVATSWTMALVVNRRENFAREDLTAYEAAAALHELARETEWTAERCASECGVSPSHAARQISAIRVLAPSILEFWAEQPAHCTLRQIFRAATMPDHDAQMEYWERRWDPEPTRERSASERARGRSSGDITRELEQMEARFAKTSDPVRRAAIGGAIDTLRWLSSGAGSLRLRTR